MRHVGAIQENAAPKVEGASRVGLRADSAITPARSTHVLQIYEEEEFFAQTVAEFVAGALVAGRPAIVVATATHQAAVLRVLEDWHREPARFVASGQLRLLDARTTLASIMDGAALSRERFASVIGGAIAQSAREHAGGPVYVHGEMVDLLWRDGGPSAAARLETLWNELAEELQFHLLCTYPMAGFAESGQIHAFDEICVRHSRVFPTEQYSQTDDDARLREVASLQQRARSHETELRLRQQLEVDLRDALAQRASAEAAVHRREQELKDCLENAAEAIHWVGADGTILWANQAELALLGYAANEYVGRNIREFYADAPVIERILHRLTDGETLRNTEARLRHTDGSIRHVLINSNVLWRDGKFIHTRCFTRDVTDARCAAAEREVLLAGEQRARREAEAANRAKSDFLAVMSHELRTPLNAIGGYVALLELGVRGTLNGAQREDLSRIQRSQRHLLGLINEVLNYTRIETGAIRFELADVRVGDVVASVEPLIRPQLDANGLRLFIDPCSIDVVARADGEKVGQVLLNLLSNAVKFTDRGGTVSVACEVDTDDAERAMVHLHVRDTGKGIPAGKLEAVFEPFVQVHTGLTRPHQGTGLGLAISRELARGMGGDLTVRSTLGEGSAFTLALPRA